MPGFVLKDTLIRGINSCASDVHLSVGDVPMLRIDGNLVRIPYAQPLTAEEMREAVRELLTESQIERFDDEREYDFSFSLDMGVKEQRFRANFSHEKGNPALALRAITANIRTMKQLGLPDDLKVMTQKNNGLFLVTGPTGSGKSTILALIQRHFDVTEGDIRFHDVPLTRLQLDSWRARLAVVNQTPFLFSDTVASNIALGKPDATQEQIEHVARLASVHEDILRLPQGYNTEVGERGVMLSGGQKQRISIARALLLEAEILILDDALSAVDGRTEHQILHNLRQWGEGRTVIISAHRLSALTEASEILVMQHGHISQRGRHEALAAQPGWYRDMYRYQQLEAALDDVPQEDKEVAGA